MTRRTLAVVGVVVVALVVAGWWWRRPTPRRDATAGRDAGAEVAAATAPGPRLARPVRDPEPPGELRLEGQVRDERDQPVAGATVRLTGRPPREVVTEPDGSFVFDRLLPATYQLAAWRDDRVAPPVALAIRPTTEPLILRLTLGTALAVRVIDDATEAAIAGARVDDDARPTVTTGADGVGTLRGLAPGFVAVAVTADGYAPALLTLALGVDPGGTVTRAVRLVRGAPVTGRVLGPDGRPVAGAWVALTGDAGGDEVETDAAGRYQIARAPAGRATVTAIADGLAPGVVDVELDGVTATTVDVQLTTGATAAGVVVDAAGAPVADATVVAFDGELAARHATTGADGRFAIRGLAAHAIELSAARGDDASPALTVDLGGGDRADLRLAIAGATIAGVVVDAAGAPVPEARVTAIGASTAARAAANDDVTDGAGRFALGPLPAGHYRLTAAWPDAPAGNTYLHGATADVDTGTTDVRLVLPAAGGITGVVSRAGAPVPRYAIAISDFEPGLSFAEPEAVRAADGRFTRTGVPPGTYVVRVVGDGFAGRTLTDVEVTAGHTTDLGTIAVEAGLAVRGRVVDAAGAPVAGAAVTLGPRPTLYTDSFDLGDDPAKAALLGTATATTDAAGGFALTGLDPHPRWPLSLVARHPRAGLSVAQPVTAPADGMTVTLAATGAVVGTVRGVTDRASVELTAAPPIGYRVVAFAGPDGRFRVPQLRPGTYQVAVETLRRRPPTPPAAGPAPVTVTVTAGTTASVTIDAPAP